MHCGPDGIYLNALGAPDGDGPGGIFMLDHETFEVKGRWEQDRGPQYLAYDFFWHLGHDTMITSEWGTPNMVKDGVNPELLLAGKYGHKLHVWDLRKRTHLQELDLGAEQQMVLELRPAHDPTRAYGFVGVVISLADLSSSILLWYLDGASGNGGEWKAKKVITIPADARGRGGSAAAAQGIQGGAAAGHRHQPVGRRPVPLRVVLGHRRAPAVRRERSVQSGLHRQREARRHRGAQRPHSAPDRPLNGGPQMVEVSRDGRRVYVTNSLYTPVGRAVLSRRHHAGGWRRSMRRRGAAWRSIRGSSSSSRMGSARTRCGCRAATRHPTPSATPDAERTAMTWTWWALSALGAGTGSIPAWAGSSPSRSDCRKRERRAVWRALSPLALGHALAIAAAVLAAAALGQIVPTSML